MVKNEYIQVAYLIGIFLRQNSDFSISDAIYISLRFSYDFHRFL